MVAGIVAALVGVGLLLWGLAPVKGFGPAMEVFGGGTPPDDLDEQINAALDGMIARAWADGVGLALIMGGIMAAMWGAKAKEFTVEERVAAELDRRGAAPAAPARPAEPEAVPAAPPRSAGSGCPTCGQPLLAGGRFCRNCGRL